MLNVIKFFEKGQPFYELSNYFPSPFTLDGKEWSSNEVFYQANKFKTTSPEYYDLIAMCDSPQKAKNLGDQKVGTWSAKWLINKKHPELGLVNDAIHKYKSVPIDPEWDIKKDEVMLRGLRAKFSQHKKSRDALLSTRSALLIENSPYDSYWGVGEDGMGKNRLGTLLIQVRQELQEA